jgi:hypothetical protein
MSNLANTFMWAGFIKEAQDLCDKAIKQDGYHKNVLESLSNLKEIPDKERVTLEEVRLKMTPKVSFYRKLGRAVAKREPVGLDGVWQGPDCLLNARVVGRSIVLIGQYERDMAGGLYGALGIGSKQTQKYNVKIEGTVWGGLIDGTIERKAEGGRGIGAGLLSIGNGKTKLILVVSPNSTAIDAIEDPYSSNPTFYSLKKGG